VSPVAARKPPRTGGHAGDWRRYAAPIVFLAAFTIAILLVRGSFGGQAQTTSTTTAATTTSGAGTHGNTGTGAKAKKTKTKTKKTTTSAAASYYEVQAGDTFGTIATKYGKSVEEIEVLNPGVSSTSLHIGQKIRVG
jgi:LysM repeat protein